MADEEGQRDRPRNKRLGPFRLMFAAMLGDQSNREPDCCPDSQFAVQTRLAGCRLGPPVDGARGRHGRMLSDFVVLGQGLCYDTHAAIGRGDCVRYNGAVETPEAPPTRWPVPVCRPPRFSQRVWPDGASPASPSTTSTTRGSPG